MVYAHHLEIHYIIFAVFDVVLKGFELDYEVVFFVFPLL